MSRNKNPLIECPKTSFLSAFQATCLLCLHQIFLVNTPNYSYKMSMILQGLKNLVTYSYIYKINVWHIEKYFPIIRFEIVRTSRTSQAATWPPEIWFVITYGNIDIVRTVLFSTIDLRYTKSLCKNVFLKKKSKISIFPLYFWVYSLVNVKVLILS